jgi:tRNA 2-selenouridine synthase SelU
MMEANKIAKQMIEFQKAAFNNTFNSIAMMQDQSEKMVQNLMQQNPALPKQSMDAFNEWLNMCKKARDDYKNAVEEGFKNLENLFGAGSKSK